jgi:hypothetical protein
VALPLSVIVNYFRRFPALNTGTPTDTNWLLQNHFNVYLFETLFQAAVYIQEAELGVRYYEMCADLRNRLSKHENRKRYGAVPKQSYGSPRSII